MPRGPKCFIVASNFLAEKKSYSPALSDNTPRFTNDQAAAVNTCSGATIVPGAMSIDMKVMTQVMNDLSSLADSLKSPLVSHFTSLSHRLVSTLVWKPKGQTGI